MSSRLLVVVATVVAALASLSVGSDRPTPLLRATSAGAVQLVNSHDGQAVLNASRLRPGESAEGTLTLTNRVPEPQRLTLSTTGVEDTPGLGGGVLSRWLDLRVERDSLVVYEGKLADLDELDLGELAGSSTTPFRFVVTLPEQGIAVDSAFAGGGVEVAWAWRGDAEVTEVPDGPGEPAPEPPAPPVEPSGGDAEPGAPPLDELDGPAAGDRVVRLWLGGRSRQRLGRVLRLSALCRPGCTLRAKARVRVGRRWRALGVRTLGRVASLPQPTALSFRLSARRQRALRAAARPGRALKVRISVTASAPGHRSVTKVRTLRLRP